MEEELNENELEERLYAMLHHVDETQNYLIDRQQNKDDATQLIENGPRSTMRRYWRTGPDTNPNPYQKLNITKEPTNPAPTVDKVTPTPAKTAPATVAKTIPAPNETTLKEERSPPKPPSPVDLSLFQSPVPQNVNKIIEFLDHEENRLVVLESSDEDEVVEVALPPKPTITIDSSDDDELQVIKPNHDQKSCEKADPKPNSGDRAVSASPVPSVVSSVSDEFIRGDCIALNISSRHPDKLSFDFSLHGSDLLGQNTNTPTKKKKRKKNKEAVTSTPITAVAEKATNEGDACFATPKSKAKNKKQKSKLLTEKSIPSPDIDDSNSNLSANRNKSKSPYTVTEKSLPSADVYESDSNQSEIVKVNTDQSKDKYVVEAYSSDSSDNIPVETPKSSKNTTSLPDSAAETVDLTGNDSYITIDNTGINDSIVMGNVTGFPECVDYGEKDTPSLKGDISKYVSSKVPAILNEDLDFDNLKGKEKICKKRLYSLTTLRAEMEKFYNESWGGEDFNHKEIQKNMSRDKSLWAIDPKDRMQSMAQRKSKCNYCNRLGHRADACRQRPAVCYMCGNPGHFEPRCPSKICVNCGSANAMYSSMCRNCFGWERVRCTECGQFGHPHTHCPDIWRRYHSTITMDDKLEICNQTKKPHQLFCSGCARRGHLVHACRVTLPFSGLPIFSPYVSSYRPIYKHPAHPRERSKSFSEGSMQRPNKNNKRVSKSPTAHETHANKKRQISVENSDATKPIAQKNPPKVDNSNRNKRKSVESPAPVSTGDKADLIPVSSSNHDNKGRVIQDNEVSDTSDAITSSRIFVTDDVNAKLKTKEGEEWLSATTAKHNVSVGTADIDSYLNIRGKLADQEVFQAALREWVRTDTTERNSDTKKAPSTEDDKSDKPEAVNNMPKNRNNLLRQINNALDLLKLDYGDPMSLYKELVYSQNQHNKMLKRKYISHKKLMNSRTHINGVLKKLNIILIGQAGLADGSEHLNELISIQKKLMRSQNKNISVELRKQIGEHYHCIFSPTARNDYALLMKKYYHHSITNTSEKAAKKKKRRQSVGAVPVPNDEPSIPPPAEDAAPPSSDVAIPTDRPRLEKENQNQTNKDRKLVQPNYLPKLMFYRKRLTDMKGCNRKTKSGIIALQRRVQQCISMLYQGNVNSKKTKKVKRLNDRVETFLAKMENEDVS